MAKKTVQRDPLGRLESEFEEENEDAILQDGERLRVPLYLKDGITPNPRLTPTQRGKAIAQQSLVTDGTANPLAMHRPGFRYWADNNQRAINDAVKAEAYNAADTRAANAWRGPTNRTNLRDAREGDVCMVQGPEFPDDFGSSGTLQMGSDGLVCVPDDLQDARRRDAASIKQAAYERYDREMADAWRSK